MEALAEAVVIGSRLNEGAQANQMTPVLASVAILKLASWPILGYPRKLVLSLFSFAVFSHRELLIANQSHAETPHP